MWKELKQLGKSAGTWFLASNAFLNSQTHPAISVCYGSIFCAQRAAANSFRTTNRYEGLRFLVGSQGLLFINGVTTLCVGIITDFYGSRELAEACFTFSAANVIQSFIWGGIIRFGKNTFKNACLVGCELIILDGLRCVAENAGFSSVVSLELVIPGIIAALVRGFKPQWLSADLAYLDMMVLAAVTCGKAFTGEHYLNAISRVLVIVGLMRLAVTRAQQDQEASAANKTSLFEVETRVPNLWKKFRKL